MIKYVNFLKYVKIHFYKIILKFQIFNYYVATIQIQRNFQWVLLSTVEIYKLPQQISSDAEGTIGNRKKFRKFRRNSTLLWRAFQANQHLPRFLHLLQKYIALEHTTSFIHQFFPFRGFFPKLLDTIHFHLVLKIFLRNLQKSPRNGKAPRTSRK